MLVIESFKLPLLAPRVDDFQSGVVEIFLVACDQAQFMMQGGGCQQAVYAGNGATHLRNQPTPAICHSNIYGQDSVAEPVSQFMFKPKSELFTARAVRHVLNSFADFA